MGESKKMKNFYRLIHGDCLKVLPTLPKESIDLIVADPPYSQTDFEWDKFSSWQPLIWNFQHVLKPNGQLFMFGKLPMLNIVIRTAKRYFDFRYELIWAKNHPAPFATDKKPLQLHENIVCFAKHNCDISRLIFNANEVMLNKKPTPRWGYQRKNTNRLRSGWKGDVDVELQRRKEKSLPRTILYASIVHPSHLPNEYMGHPTQKPEKLVKWMIKVATYPNQTVLAPFVGSGTAIKCCQDLNRNCIGIEIKPDYCDIVKKRCFGRNFLDREVEYQFEVFEKMKVLGAV